MAKRSRSSRKRKGRASGKPKFSWIPLWGWILIFLIPLLLSEFMFYKAGRVLSMILFPIAWIGFWATVMHRSGWPILKKRK